VIVLAYGKLASCVALASFIESSEQFIAKVREDANADRDPNWFTALVGTPAMCSIGSVVVIPSFHPGHIAYAGSLAPYLIELFFLVHQIAWFAIDVAMNCDKSLPRNVICKKVLQEVESILKSEHDFGERFSQSSETSNSPNMLSWKTKISEYTKNAQPVKTHQRVAITTYHTGSTTACPQ
jgi:hypothetical protein